MIACLAIACLASAQEPFVIRIEGGEVVFKCRLAERPARGASEKLLPHEWIEEVFAKDARGKWRLILTSPAAERVALAKSSARATALRRTSMGLFAEPPSMGFQRALVMRDPDGTTLRLIREDPDVTIEKSVRVPRKGRTLQVAVRATFPKHGQRIQYFLDSYAFSPDGKRLSQGGRPDATFTPGLRPQEGQVVGDHFFRAPVIVAQKGDLAALMLPDLDVLADNRPIPTILDLDAKNGVVDATLMSYGFADHRLAGHVYYAHDSGMSRKAPKELLFAYDLIVDARAEPFAAYRQAVTHTWERYGRKNFEKVLPQAMPFEEYAKYCYPAAFNEAYGTNKLGWFEVVIDGQVCGGIPAGWGFTNGWVSWQCWFNQLRSAWGLRWWGMKLGDVDWVGKADKMLNLALAAPMDRGACPTTYLSREKTWLGSLIRPREDCYYDLTNMAWKGIWLLRWLEFEDCPRRGEILRQCREMAELMMRHQNADGSFPTWLTKEHEVVPILDRSAQSALPAWFLAEYVSAWPQLAQPVVRAQASGAPDPTSTNEARELERVARTISPAKDAALRSSDFLVKNVVDQQRYYDFETFFSCSPKACLQVNGKLDDVAMHDPHTLSPPQNTLSMQWTAEALFAVSSLLSSESGSNYRAAALKALDLMALYQNVWSLPYRKAAYTFGGFGVQNTDGEYLDARQAQFGCTLADIGVALARRDYFERGVAAVRASMTLINHPLHADNGLYPNPNYPPGLQPENTGHGGTDQQNGRTGFDWGEGSGLAAMAWLLHRGEKVYGSYAAYSGESWGRIIDGGYEGQKHFPRPPTPLVDPSFDFSDWRMRGWTVEGNFAEVPTFSERMDFGVADGEGFIGTCEDGAGGYDDRFTGTITSPPFRVTKPKIKLLVGGGAGEGVFVELVEDPTGATTFNLRSTTFLQHAVARGQNRERMREVEWDVSTLKGKVLRIRIVDRETGGWGHVNVARIRCVD